MASSSYDKMSSSNDMTNSTIREAIVSVVVNAIETDAPFKNPGEFWYHIEQQLEKHHGLVRSGKHTMNVTETVSHTELNIERWFRTVYQAVRAKDPRLPDDVQYIRKIVQANVAAAQATQKADEVEHALRNRGASTSDEFANRDLVQTARVALALLEKREAEEEAKKKK
jgi:ferritin-like protein